MTTIPRALCWAAVILLMAAASRWANMGNDVVTAVLIVLPAIAWMEIRERRSCISPWDV
jgi:uncharacterized protein involved in response to NO